VGSGVWIEFEGGDVSYPIWVGGYWRTGEFPEGVGKNVRVIVTVKGLTLTFDDDQTQLTLADKTGNTVTLNKSGLTIANGQQSVAVTSSSVKINNDAFEVQ
jgi:hypothetical protein